MILLRVSSIYKMGVSGHFGTWRLDIVQKSLSFINFSCLNFGPKCTYTPQPKCVDTSRPKCVGSFCQ